MKNLDVKSIKNIGLVAKLTPELPKNIKILKEILAKFSINLVLEHSICKALSLNESGYTEIELAKKCELLISLGGDGTIISLCRKTAEISPFVLGIHAGRLGFLTDTTMCECERFFAEFFEGRFSIETPFMLDVALHKKNGEIVRKVAFNDAVIVGEKVCAVTHIEACLNGKHFNSYFGDGIMATTPVGSTAYNMSANGPIVYPLSPVFIVTPINSHSLTQRPVVLPGHFEVAFKTVSAAVLVIDGQDRFKMSNLDLVSVRLSEKTARLVRHLGRDYFQILKEKLHWGYND
ncbi:NAD(+) kinase [Campylobacter sp. faydin G-105]|uniref:NAD(+) kinase n=1 Tax=Campylobacter anatolicus TaxID=2829105 RepID=UPI001B982606|nr:NAD(+) kinase [Campylobacter anatolicus]MBR8462544.1 NAD(+) kinase [Campylobacter anatolicus]